MHAARPASRPSQTASSTVPVPMLLQTLVARLMAAQKEVHEAVGRATEILHESVVSLLEIRRLALQLSLPPIQPHQGAMG